VSDVLPLLHFVGQIGRVPFFFFQAVDGIRDLYVTGVQTCALPIFEEAGAEDSHACSQRPERASVRILGARLFEPVAFEAHEIPRSEERRVGQEGGSLGSWYSCENRHYHNRGRSSATCKSRIQRARY